MESGGSNFYGRGGGGRGRGRGRGRSYQNQDGSGYADGGGGGGGGGDRGRGDYQYQGRNEINQDGGGNGGRGRSRGRGNYQYQGRGDYQNQWSQDGGGYGGGDRGDYQYQSRGNNQNRDGGGNAGGGGGRGDFQYQSRGSNQNRDGGGNAGGGGGRGDYQYQGGRGSYQNQWNRGGGGRGRTAAPSVPQQWASRPPPVQQTWAPPAPMSPPPQPSADGHDKKISEQLNLAHESGVPEIDGKQMHPIKRPDRGGTVAIRSIRLLVNHFPVRFDPNKTIFHYDVDVKPQYSGDKKVPNKPLRKSDLRLIRDTVFSENQFPNLVTAYDGEKNIFSAVSLPTGRFEVKIPGSRDGKTDCYIFTIKYVNELKLSKLDDYLKGNLPYIPRDILQGMDLVMKENPSDKRIFAGRSYFPYDYSREKDLSRGLKASRGFHQSLKSTSQGLVLCLDYSTLAFCKPVNVIEFLMGCVRDFRGVNDVKRFRREIDNALKGLKVHVTHRKTKQKYTISGLAREDARDSYFLLEDPEGKRPPQNTGLVNYFKEKWGKDIVHQNIPCLELGKNNKSNKVPMEFCIMVQGQVYRKDRLNSDIAKVLKKETLVNPLIRKNTINEMVQAEDGPCGDVIKKFEISVDQNMTRTVGRVIGAPELRIGAPSPIRVDAMKCQWNLVDKPVLDGKLIERWALLDFTGGDRYNQLHANAFIENLRNRCRRLGMQMDAPLLHHIARMDDFSSVKKLENLLTNLVRDARQMNKGKLQMIVCVMTRKDPGYKSLKLVSETQVGVVTQCCLSRPVNEGKDQYLANLCLKINAKLGGNNFELSGKLPHFENKDQVMFIGADVNHPPPMNKACPSIAAVVATVNWPAANRYAARVSPQAHRKENIVNFGTICSNLVDTYAQLNKVRPNKIVVFRDGVSDDQFEMALSELLELKNAINDGHYQPTITLVVAQKRHQTRLFVENRNDGGTSGNVPPGTVVDTTIVHPFDFDFYLCSHYGGLGTSKPTHYYVLWDENFFTSDEMQKLIYEMCFTFARCTKPVSLVPPVYYADLVAYRGRMFQEAMMDTSLSSYASTSSRSSDTPTFDASLYKMHPDLENIMFFV